MPRAVLSLPVSSAQALGLVPWVCSEEEEASVSEPHAGPSPGLVVPRLSPRSAGALCFSGERAPLQSRRLQCCREVGLCHPWKTSLPKGQGQWGKQWSRRQAERHCCLRGTGFCLPATRMVSCPPLCGRLRVRGFSLPPLQDVQNKLKESAQCVGDEFMNCKLAAQAKVLARF